MRKVDDLLWNMFCGWCYGERQWRIQDFRDGGFKPKGDPAYFFHKKHYENEHILTERSLILVPFKSASKGDGTGDQEENKFKQKFCFPLLSNSARYNLADKYMQQNKVVDLSHNIFSPLFSNYFCEHQDKLTTKQAMKHAAHKKHKRDIWQNFVLNNTYVKRY